MAKEARSKLPVEVLFIGECGSGKSSTINHLLGQNVCETGKTFNRQGITTKIQSYHDKWAVNAELVLGSKDEVPFEKEHYTRSKNINQEKHETYQLSDKEEISEVKHTSRKIGSSAEKNTEKQATENKDNEAKQGSLETIQKSKNAKTGHTKTLIEQAADDIFLYDTPIFDDTIENIRKNSMKFHAIALVFPLTRYTEDRRRFLERVRKAFDEKLFKHVIIIFTHTESLEGDVAEEVKEVAQIDNVFGKFISESNERYIVCKGKFKNEQERNAFKKSFYEKLTDILCHEEKMVCPSQRSYFPSWLTK